MCFVVSILCIGIVTAIIGDVASHFGCTLGIKDSVTAIVFVALGTSIPGKYFAKIASFVFTTVLKFKIRSRVKWLLYKINMQMLALVT